MVAIFEPFVNANKVKGYKNILGVQHCTNNYNGQIQYFWRDSCQAVVVFVHEQQIYLRFRGKNSSDWFFITAVYAKCTTVESNELQSSLESLNTRIVDAWCIKGDFNAIHDPEEKVGGKTTQKLLKF